MNGGDSAYLLAIRSATGVEVRHDLGASLSYLEQAAQSGHRQAQMELAALVGNFRLASEISSGKAVPRRNWADLRAAINVKGWLTVPQGRILSSAPRIAMVERYLSAPMCDWLIRLARPYLKRAQIFDTESGHVRDDDTRDNDAAVLEPERMDTVTGFVRARIAALADVSVTALEPTQILHYEVGQQFGAHVDFLDINTPALAANVRQHGQRAMTVLVYLNDDYLGGDTAFLDLGSSYKGRKGDALVFWNITETGEPDWRTRHVGTAPTQGVKWLLSQWIRIQTQ